MAKGVRFPEKAFGVAMWVVSVILAAFIVGLGNLVIGDLPQVESSISQDQFADKATTERIAGELRSIRERRGVIDDKLEVARLQLEQAQKASTTGTETFQAWIQARTATTNPAQDPEVLARTRELEQLKANERTVQSGIDTLESELVPISQREGELNEQQNRLQAEAYPAFEQAMFWQELRIFGLRLAITLPMLLLAGWMVIKKR